MGLEETETLGGHQQGLVYTRTQGRGAATPQETEGKLAASVGGLWRRGLAGARHRDEGTGGSLLA